MKIEEAILYVLAERNGGLKTEQIAQKITNGRYRSVGYIKADGTVQDASYFFFKH